MSKDLKAWKIVKEYVEYCLDIRNGCEAIQWNSTYDFLKPFIDEIDKQSKALEIIKECFYLNGFDELMPNHKWFESKEKQDLLKEVLK